MYREVKVIEFQGKPWTLVLTKYLTGEPALMLRYPNGIPAHTCTVNIPEDPLQPGYVYIKDYAENEGMLEALIKAEVVRDTGQRLMTRYVQFPVCQLLIPLEEEACPPNAS